MANGNNGLFVDAGTVAKGIPEGAAPHKQHKNIYVMEAEKKGDYEFGKSISGQIGTQVPEVSLTGGVEGSDNPYGTIVVGKVYKGSEDNAVGEFRPDILNTKEEKEEEEEVEEETSEEDISPQQVLVKEKGEELEDILDSLKEEAVTTESQEKCTQLFSPVISAPVISTKIVQVSGEFGTFKGKYRDIIVQDKLVILTYVEDDPVFTPPAATKPIIIGCESSEYKVYYTGIEFSLPQYKLGVQVFGLVKDN